MTAPILGMDPGHTGAAFLLSPDGRRSLGAWYWRRMEGRTVRPPYVLQSTVAPDCERASLHAVGCDIAWHLHELGLAPALCVEGLFVHPELSKETAIELGRTVGLLTGPLLGVVSAQLPSPVARTWRPAVLGIPSNSSSEKADAAALRWVVTMGLAESLGALAAIPHVAEASAISEWARRHLHPSQISLPSRRDRRRSL